MNLLGVLSNVELLTGAGWDLEAFLTNSRTTLDRWFGLAVMLLGLVAVAYAVWQIVSGLMSHGKKQTNWALAIILLLVGGTLSVSNGWDFMKQISAGGQKTIEDLGGGMIIPYIKSLF